MARISFWVAVFYLLLGCGNCEFSVGKSREDKIIELLEGDGHQNVRLSESETKGQYTFTGEKGPQACTGTVETEGTDVKWRSECPEVLPLGRLDEKCTGGDQPSCVLFAKALVNGDGIEADGPRSTTLFQKACEAGEAVACFYVGLAHARGDRGVAQDAEAAHVMYNKACEGEVPEACHNLATQILDNPSPSASDKERLVQLLEAHCSDTQKLSCGLFGQALADGRHMESDPTRARPLLTDACGRSEQRSCARLGIMLMEGVGGEANPGEGLIHLSRACDANQVGACVDLGRVYLEGIGVTKQAGRGKAFLQKACELGHQGACQAAQGGRRRR